jgi:hypothetical protein
MKKRSKPATERYSKVASFIFTQGNNDHMISGAQVLSNHQMSENDSPSQISAYGTNTNEERQYKA